MTSFLKPILPLALYLMSITLPVEVHARAAERAHSVRQGLSDGEVWFQLRQEVLQRQMLQRELLDLGQSLKDDVNVTRASARDANERLEKQMVQGFQMLDGRIGFIQTLLVLIFTALLAVLGGALLIWRELIKLEQTLGY